eukprot:45302_1
MFPSFPPDVSTWDRTQTKHWLHLKGFSTEIQNKFYDETIDGAALLRLLESDINTLLAGTCILFCDRMKLRAYISELQSNPHGYPLPALHPSAHSIHTLPSTNHDHIQTSSPSPLHPSSMFDKFDSPPYEYRNALGNASSSNSTFDAISHIPSEISTENTAGQAQPISVNTMPLPKHPLWTPMQPCIVSASNKPILPLKECVDPMVITTNIKKEEETLHVTNEEDEEEDHQSSLEPIVNDIQMKHNEEDPYIPTRKRRKKRRVIDDSSDDDDEDTDANTHTTIKAEKTYKTSLFRKRKRMHQTQDVSRPLKRIKLGANVMTDGYERDTDEDHVMTSQQKHSGRYAIRSTNNSLQHQRAKQQILKQKHRDKKHRIKREIKTERRTSKHVQPTLKVSNIVDKRADIKQVGEELSKKEPYRYSNHAKHDQSNVGKRWTPNELEIIWNLHYEKHWTNLQIAEKFKRTECGIMVQIDKIYKDKRSHNDLVNKKYLYQKKVDAIVKGEKKWSEKEHKWKSVKEELSKKEPYRYSNHAKHDQSNVGKRWTPNELEIIWNLHYEKHWTNLQIAEKFKRTECGIMVQIDKIYKDKRSHNDLVNKKYLYQKKVDAIVKGEKKWSEKEHKWKSVKEEMSEEDSSDDDDDEPIGLRMARVKQEQEETTNNAIGDAWDTPRYVDGELTVNGHTIMKQKGGNRSSAFLKNTVCKGKHCWKFKFNDASGTAPFCVGLWNEMHRVRQVDLADYLGKYGDRAYVFDAFVASTNVFGEDDEWNEEDEYGVKVQNGDIVSMEVDFTALTLRFAVNQIDLGVAHYIQQGTYRAAVSIYHEQTTIELTGYIA